MVERTLTSANSVIMLSVTDLFPVPQQIQGFSTDNIFSTDAIAAAETSMGVDGKLSGGFIFVEKPTTIVLQSDSTSISFFDAWVGAQEAVRDLYIGNGIVMLPSLQTVWTLTRGILKTYPPIPGLGKIVQARSYGIVWEKMSPAPMVR